MKKMYPIKNKNRYLKLNKQVTTREKLLTIINHFGIKHQIMFKLSEEIGEFQDALMGKDIAHMEEEAADSLNVIAELVLVKKLNPANIRRIMEEKIDRTLDRIDTKYYEDVI